MIEEQQYLEAVEIVAQYKSMIGQLVKRNDITEADKSKMKLDIETKRLNSIYVCIEVLNDIHQIRNKSREIQYRVKRQAVMWWLCKYSPFTLFEIGRLTGGFDHATVLNGRNKINEYIDNKDTDMLYHCRKMWNVLDDYKP
jgi:chromosomal replication initiation ATPase DnaA